MDGLIGTTSLTVPEPPPVSVTNVEFTRNKKHMVTQITVDFSGPVNASDANSVAMYRLATPGKKGSFDAKNAAVIKLKSAKYDAALEQVVLTPKKLFALSKPVQLRVDGLAPTGLQDASGRLIDGDDDGQPGGNAVAVLRAGGVTMSAMSSNPSGGNSTVPATGEMAMDPAGMMAMTPQAVPSPQSPVKPSRL